MSMKVKDEQALIADALSRGGNLGPTAQLPALSPEKTPPTMAKGRTAQYQPGRMNKTEADYARHLEDRKALGDVADYWFEAFKLRLADKTWLTVDFLVMLKDGSLQLHETKGGFMREDSFIKLKVAASQFPIFRFYLCRKEKRGGWTVKEVSGN